MSRDREDMLQRAKDALKNALAELETEPQNSSQNTETTVNTRSPNAVDRQRQQSATDDFR